MAEVAAASVGFILAMAAPPTAISALYPGRRILFDLGTGLYSSGSIPWLVDTFWERGIDFDAIYGAMLPQLRCMSGTASALIRAGTRVCLCCRNPSGGPAVLRPCSTRKLSSSKHLLPGGMHAGVW